MRRIALLASIGTVLVSFWLLSVVTIVLPRLHSEQIPFWTLVMIGLFAFGALSVLALRRERSSGILNAILLPTSIAAVGLGGAAVVENELRAARGGDWEGYPSLMGILLAIHGALLLAQLLRQRRATSASRSS